MSTTISSGIIAGSNTAIAVKKLREMIFSGDLGAGTDHLESELAIKLGMSRTPVREALLRLEAQGLVQVRPRKGVRIKTLSTHDMAEIYDVLTELESLAASDAANRNLSDADLIVMSTSIADMQAAIAADDRKSWALADDIFHQEIVRLGGNARVAMIVAMMSDQVRRARNVTLYMRPAPTQSNVDHARVLEAIRQGDAKTARDTHRAHRIATKQKLIDLLKRHQLSNI